MVGCLGLGPGGCDCGASLVELCQQASGLLLVGGRGMGGLHVTFVEGGPIRAQGVIESVLGGSGSLARNRQRRPQLRQLTS